MSNYLIHYASKYYDPEYAHQYYEEHKKLKGKTYSSAKLNDTGKEAAAYVKNQLQTEKKNNIAASKEKLDATIASAKEDLTSTIEQFTTQMQSKIDALNRRIKAIKGSGSKLRKAAIRQEIAQYREENNAKKVALKEAYTATATSAKEEHATNKENYESEYDTNYETEMDKIYSDPSFLKTSSSTSSSSSSSTTNKNTKTKTDDYKYIENKNGKKYKVHVYK